MLQYLLHTQAINQRCRYYNISAIATYSYLHAIHSHAIGYSRNSLLNTSYIAQLHMNVHVADIARLHIKCVCSSYCPVATLHVYIYVAIYSRHT